jgi:hypothetical protein
MYAFTENLRSYTENPKGITFQVKTKRYAKDNSEINLGKINEIPI